MCTFFNVFSQPSGLRILPPEGKTRSISQYGISWYFNKDVEYGQYVNGDYWVVGPIDIVAINPPSQKVGDRYINGSMLNPMGSATRGGFDSGPTAWYNHSLNVGWNVSAENPLSLTPGSSLISSKSGASRVGDEMLTDVAILTVVKEAPQINTFRPPYAGINKAMPYTKKDLDTALLQSRSIPTVGVAPSWSEIEYQLHRPFMDFGGGWFRRDIHGGYGVYSPSYGRETSQHHGAVSLALLRSDASIENKMNSLVYFVQRGIDLYGIYRDARDNGRINPWHADGGHHGGRKWAIIFAGIMLNDARMKGVGKEASVSNYLFHEDGQVEYISAWRRARTETSFNSTTLNNLQTQYPAKWVKFQNDYPALAAISGTGEWTVDIREYGFQPYTGLEGVPEWHGGGNSANASWDRLYRHVSAGTWHGQALAALVLGARDLWDWPAFFDYVHRHNAIMMGGIVADPWAGTAGYNPPVPIYAGNLAGTGLINWNRFWYQGANISTFINNMWNAYWGGYY